MNHLSISLEHNGRDEAIIGCHGNAHVNSVEPAKHL